MDILLTAEEWNAAAEEGIKKWLLQLTEPTAFESSAPFAYAEVCRAQVRKVVEWMKGHSSAPYGESRRMTVGQNDILLLYPNAQALKAVGEGK